MIGSLIPYIFIGWIFSMITLIIKEDDARVMKKFRPISLLNCIFILLLKNY
jgi:hypothetical protein